MLIYVLKIISIIIGVIVMRFLLHRKITIRFNVSVFDWMMPVFVCFFFISLAILLENGLSCFVLNKVSAQNMLIRFLVNLVDGGLFIPIIAFICSFMFGKINNSLNLDLNLMYDVSVAKIFLSITILSNSLIFYIYTSIIANNEKVNAISDRFCTRMTIWIIMAISIWLPVGVGCKGRLNENKENEREAEGNKNRLVDVCNCYFPMLTILSVVIIFYVITFFGSAQLNNLMTEGYRLFMLAASGSYIYAFYFLVKERPSTKRSEKKLAKMVKEIESATTRTTHFRDVEYNIFLEGEKAKLVVEPKKVYFAGYQEEADSAMGKREIICEKEGCYIIFRQFLKTVYRDRKRYCEEAFERCRMEYQTKLEQESK